MGARFEGGRLGDDVEGRAVEVVAEHEEVGVLGPGPGDAVPAVLELGDRVDLTRSEYRPDPEANVGPPVHDRRPSRHLGHRTGRAWQ